MKPSNSVDFGQMCIEPGVFIDLMTPNNTVIPFQNNITN